MRFIENSLKMKAMVIMVQEEVAYRFCADKSNSDYGAITVGINLRGNAQIVIKVPRDKFTPPPNVDSAVVKIDINPNKFEGLDFTKVRNVVRCAFSSRRKMLVNNLMNGFKLDRATAEKILIDAGLALTCRGENLDANEYVKLTEVVEKNGVKL
jgi:16S rRNA (adenine1518-N6/adenine1519-N6)-dimethyltransferase